MHIVFVSPEFVTEIGFDGGLANYLYNIASALLRRGHRITVIVSSDQNETIIFEGIHVVRVAIRHPLLAIIKKGLRGRFYEPFHWLRQSWQLNQALRKLHHVRPINIVQYASYAATALFRKRYISSVVRISSYQKLYDQANEVNSWTAKAQNFLELQACKRSDALFGPSRLVADAISRDIDRTVNVIESPLMPILKGDNALYKQHLADKHYLLFFGSLALLKGVKEIAGVLPQFFAQYPHHDFVFVGKDLGYGARPMMEYVHEQIGQDHRQHCIYLPSMSKASLLPIIQHAHAVVLPSRIDNFPNTCIEAMMQKKIVIGTYDAGFDQLLEHGKNGFLCKASDVQGLWACIESVMALSEEEQKRIGMRAEETTHRLAADKIGQKLEQFYLRMQIDN